MWMSELATRSGLPVPTIKYYLREQLLPAGEAVGATRARYDDSHVRRLRLVRALTEVAGLRIDDVRAVLAAIDDPQVALHEAIGRAHTRLPSSVEPDHGHQQASRVEELLDRHGWELDAGSPHREALAGALGALAALDRPVSDAHLDTYAEAAGAVAEHDLASVFDRGGASDRTSTTEHAVIGTLLLEPVLLTLRRIAHENVSRGRPHADAT